MAKKRAVHKINPLFVQVYVAATLALQVIGRSTGNDTLTQISLFMLIPLAGLALWLAPVRLLKALLLIAAMLVIGGVSIFIPAWLYAEFIFLHVDSSAIDATAIILILASGLTVTFLIGKRLNKALGDPMHL